MAPGWIRPVVLIGAIVLVLGILAYDWQKGLEPTYVQYAGEAFLAGAVAIFTLQMVQIERQRDAASQADLEVRMGTVYLAPEFGENPPFRRDLHLLVTNRGGGRAVVDRVFVATPRGDELPVTNLRHWTHKIDPAGFLPEENSIGPGGRTRLIGSFEFKQVQDLVGAHLALVPVVGPTAKCDLDIHPEYVARENRQNQFAE